MEDTEAVAPAFVADELDGEGPGKAAFETQPTLAEDDGTADDEDATLCASSDSSSGCDRRKRLFISAISLLDVLR